MTDETICFFHPQDPYGCLSNASGHRVHLDGISWQSVEHYFQTSKFEDTKLRHTTMNAETPAKARRFAQKNRRSQRPRWHDIKHGIMRKALHAKAQQNADVRAVLRATAPARLQQLSEAGDYWGGDKNMLGKLWMQVRDRLGESRALASLSRAPLPPPWEKYPELGRTSMGWRMGYGEAYWEVWNTYFYGLSPAGRVHYRQLFVPPKAWQGFYEH